MSLLAALNSGLKDQVPITPPGEGLEHAVYVVPHQDDELLTMGAAIRADRKMGRTVYAILMCRGNKSVVRTGASLTSFLGYTPTEQDFGAARDREWIESCKRLGAIPILPTWEERQDEQASQVQIMVDLVKAKVPSGGVLRTTSHNDYHHDHRMSGQAVAKLLAEGWGTDGRFMLSAERKTSHAPGGVQTILMGETDVIRPFHTWPYTHRHKNEGWWGVGYVSVSPSFDYLLDVDSGSYWHTLLADPNFPGLAYVGTGAGSQAATSANPATPTGQVGDLGIRILGNKPFSSVLTTPSGWSQLGTITNGSVAPTGQADTGSVRITSWQQTATSTAAMSGTSTGSPAAAQVVGRAMRFSKAALSSWDVQSIEFARTSETGQVSDASTVVPSDHFFRAGDRFVIGVALKSDVINHTSQVLTIEGTTLSITWDTKFTGTSGSDMALYTGQGVILSGSSPSGAAVSYSAACNNNSAAASLSIVRVREVPAIVA